MNLILTTASEIHTVIIPILQMRIKKSNDLPKVTQLAGGQAGLRDQQPGSSSYPLCCALPLSVWEALDISTSLTTLAILQLSQVARSMESGPGAFLAPLFTNCVT